MKKLLAIALLMLSSALALAADNYRIPTAAGTQTTLRSIEGPAGVQTLQVSVDGLSPGSVTHIAGNASGTTGAVVGTLAGAASVTTYICGFNVSAIGGTAAVGPIVVAGVIGASQNYELSSSATGVFLSQNFTPCIPASAANTSITITTVANGTATGVRVNSWGYRR